VGIAIANLMHLFNPPCFVLGGGVTASGPFLFEPVRETVRHMTMMPRFWQGTEIVSAALGDDAGLLGATVLASSEVGEA
jgi:glucokinase